MGQMLLNLRNSKTKGQTMTSEVSEILQITDQHVVPIFSFTRAPGATDPMIDQGYVMFKETHVVVDGMHMSILRPTGFSLMFKGVAVAEVNAETPDYASFTQPYPAIAPNALMLRRMVDDKVNEIVDGLLKEHPQAKPLPYDGTFPEAPPEEAQLRAFEMMERALAMPSRTTNVHNQPGGSLPDTSDDSPPPLPTEEKPASKGVALPPGVKKAKGGPRRAKP